MLYRDINGLCSGLSDHGYTVSVITNGWFCDCVRDLVRRDVIHAVSISFGSLACVHDKIRRRPGAFQKSLAGLSTLVAAGVQTGAVVAVTRESQPLWPDLVALLVHAGLCQIQFHPVAAVGRTQDTPETCSALNEEQMLRLLLLSQAFRQFCHPTAFGTDALTGIDIGAASVVTPRTLISTLVWDDTGSLHLFAYGMKPDFLPWVRSTGI